MGQPIAAANTTPPYIQAGVSRSMHTCLALAMRTLLTHAKTRTFALVPTATRDSYTWLTRKKGDNLLALVTRSRSSPLKALPTHTG